MTFNRLLLAALTFFSMLLPASESMAKVYLTREQALKTALAEAGTVTEDSIRITSSLAKQIKEKGGGTPSFSSKTIYIGKRGEEVLGYAIIDNVKGKSRPITYMVLISPEGKIKRVEILAYRESHGGEIRYPSFLKQFIGKTISDPIRAKQDIRNISGATISCRSIADGVRTLLALWEEVYGENATHRKDEKLAKRVGHR